MVLRAKLFDSRYTITREIIGVRLVRWVLRYCGEYVGDYSTEQDAEEAKRLASLRDIHGVDAIETEMKDGE